MWSDIYRDHSRLLELSCDFHLLSPLSLGISDHILSSAESHFPARVIPRMSLDVLWTYASRTSEIALSHENASSVDGEKQLSIVDLRHTATLLRCEQYVCHVRTLKSL